MLDEFNINAPAVTEVRRLLQTLTRQDAGRDKKVYMMASTGLYDLLHRIQPLDIVTRPTPINNLFAITIGRATGSPGEAYNDTEFAGLLDAVRPKYDLIFIDAAPVVPVVEPLLMAEHVDSVLAVTMAGRTPLMLVRRIRYYGYEQPLPKRIRTTARSAGTGGPPASGNYVRDGGVDGSRTSD